MSELKYLLESHLESLVAVQGLLAREKDCLLASGETDIHQVAIDKQRGLDRLNESGQGLKRYVEREGFETSPKGLARCIERAPDTGELSNLRDRINDELRICAELNQTNGVVLESNRAASERALRVLLSTHGHADRYQPTGRFENIGSRQSIGKA